MAAPRNRAQRRPAHSKQIGKSHNNCDHWQRQADSCERFRRSMRNMANVDPVHYAVQHIDQLSQRHGQCQTHNITRDTALAEIILVSQKNLSSPNYRKKKPPARHSKRRGLYPMITFLSQ